MTPGVHLFQARDGDPNVEGRGVNPGLAELIIAKQRNGPTGRLALGFVERYTKFVSLSSNNFIKEL